MDAEAVWDRLRRKGLKGMKFRGQHPVGRFVVDFCCPKAGLIVEVDGKVHEGRADEDAVCTETLEAEGYRMVRFTNRAVLKDVEGVLSRNVALSPRPPLPLMLERGRMTIIPIRRGGASCSDLKIV